MALREIETLPARLTYARERAGVTRAALAAMIGAAPPDITRYESGERVPTIERVILIARALSVPVGWLVADEGSLSAPVPIPGGRDRRRKQ